MFWGVTQLSDASDLYLLAPLRSALGLNLINLGYCGLVFNAIQLEHSDNPKEETVIYLAEDGQKET